MTSELVRSHPVLECVALLEAALESAADLDPGWLTGAEKRAVLMAMTSVASRVEGLRLRVLAAGEELGDVAADDGSRDAASWLAHHARLDPGRARHLTRLGTALESRWTRVGAALTSGQIDLERAAVVVRALEDLPDDLDAELLGRAEAALVDEARHLDPRRLRTLGRRVLAHVAPDVADAHEARLLADEDVRARAVAFLRTRRRGDGTTEVHARLPDAAVDRLTTYLHAFTSPRQDGARVDRSAQAPVDRRPHDQQLGHAFVAFLETVDPQRLPLHGGDATTVVVTLDHQTLTDRLEAAGVAHIGDSPVTAAQARRLACTAGILPAVLDGDSQVLDLGRRRRLFSPAQRKALALRHPACGADGCDIPAAWCEAHHAGTPWSRGGRTDLAEGVLLCSHHHHRAHDPRYETSRHPDGSVRFHRRV